jgi:hypothetical protein
MLKIITGIRMISMTTATAAALPNWPAEKYCW